MRPIKLSMQAFGCFSEKTEIDFTCFNQNKIYLITGPTGSGKTTIFDAVVYALYGERSGTIRNKNGIRSDYVNDNIETYVSLDFEVNDKFYHITRKPSYKKEGRKTDVPGSIVLSYDNLTFTKNGEVAKEIEKIIGLNVEQFRQVVMLSQGEFMALINSESSKRDEIFRRIFNTAIYANLSLELNNHLKVAKDKLKETEGSIKANINSLSEIIDEANNYNESPSYTLLNKLIDFINEELKKDKKELKKLTDNNKKLKESIDSINNEISLGTINNNNLDELDKLNIDYQKLLDRKEEIKLLEDKINILSKAKDIKIYHDKLNDVINRKDNIEKDYNNFKVDYDKLIDEYLMYKSQEDFVNLDRESLKQIEELLKIIDVDIKKYQDVQSLENKNKGLDEELTKNNSSKEELDKEIIKLNEELDICNEAKDTKNNVEKDILESNHSLNDLKDKVDSLVDYKELINQLNNSLVLLNKEKEELTKLEEKYNSLIELKEQKEHDYYLSTAYLLSKNLKDNEPCPVCGSIHHVKMPEPQDVVTSDELEKLNKSINQQNEKIGKKKDSINKLELNINNYKDKLKETLSVDDNYVDAFNAYSKKINNDYNECLNKNEKLKDLLNELENKISSIESLNTSLDKAKSELNDLNKEIVRLTTTIDNNNKLIDNILKEVPYTLDELLENQIIQKEQYDFFKDNIEQFDKNLEALENEKRELDGKNSEKLNSLNSLKTEYDTSLKNYNDNLAKNGFSLDDDLNDYFEELINLDKYKETVTEYKTNLKTTKKSLEEKKKSTTGLVRVDLDKIKNKKDELDKKHNASSQVEQEMNTRFEMFNSHYNQLKTNYEKYLEASKEYETYNNLYRLASGNNPKKMSFERYILTDYFDKILGYANIRLSKMSDSRFELRRKEDKISGNAQQGLDIVVMDYETGKERDAKTLSGGETFKAALSLALGLADAIEGSSGGIEIDSLFIDEGFGTLDTASLHSAIDVLDELSSENKTIAIISHVEELKEIIPSKIIVSKKDNGSQIKIIN